MIPSPQTSTSATTLAEQLRGVKQELHAMMNGPVSNSMRSMGLNYKVIFGVELPRLQQIAETLPHTAELAAALWKENIRECRLLAGMLMPPNEFDWDLAEVWVEQMHYAEEAECTVMHLFARLDGASDKVFAWISSDEPMHRACGFMLLGRLMAGGAMLGERDAAEFLDHTAAALTDESPLVRSAARNTLLKFMNQNEAQEQAAERMLNNTFPATENE